MLTEKLFPSAQTESHFVNVKRHKHKVTRWCADSPDTVKPHGGRRLPDRKPQTHSQPNKNPAERRESVDVSGLGEQPADVGTPDGTADPEGWSSPGDIAQSGRAAANPGEPVEADG